jgi:hypothetical protein
MFVLPYRFRVWTRLYNRVHSYIGIPPRPKFLWQRLTRGWSDADVWGFDTYLARVISGGCEHLAKTTHGHPSEVESIERWQETLRDITSGMRGFLEFQDADYFESAAQARVSAQLKKSLRLLGTYFGVLWD